LARAQLPTRYVFPALIISEPISQVADVDYPGEVERILDTAPRAVLIRDDNEGNTRVNEIRARLQRDYVVGTRIVDTVVYIRKPAMTGRLRSSTCPAGQRAVLFCPRFSSDTLGYYE